MSFDPSTDIEFFKTPKKVGPFTVYNVTPVSGGESLLFTADDVNFVYDTGFGFSSEKLAENIKNVLGNNTLDYILLTHSHYDHALGSAALRILFPGAKVVASPYVAYVFTRDGAKRTMQRLDDTEAHNKGYEPVTKYTDKLAVDIQVSDGDVLNLGSHKLKILELPGHTKDCVAYYFEDENIMLGCETTGVLASKDVVIMAALVGLKRCLASLDRMAELAPKYYFVPHQGMIGEEGYRFFIELSKRCHLKAKDMILECHRRGLDNEEILKVFMDEFYLEGCREIYPYAAAYENNSIMIPQVIEEFKEE